MEIDTSTASCRGQIYLYLGMLAVPPPLYGLTSEEAYENSLHEKD